MASITSLSSSSSSSSIYGNRTYNIISGLASGLDTEELISGVVQSYQQKIQSLQQKNHQAAVAAGEHPEHLRQAGGV